MSVTGPPAGRRTALANTRSLAGEPRLRNASPGAEGATTPETLRQKDREGYDLLESGTAQSLIKKVSVSTEGVIRTISPGKSLRSNDRWGRAFKVRESRICQDRYDRID